MLWGHYRTTRLLIGSRQVIVWGIIMIKIEEFSDIHKYGDILGDFSYKDIANVLGCSEQAVKYWFGGYRKPNGSVLKALEWYLNYCLLQKETDAKLKRIHAYYNR